MTGEANRRRSKQQYLRAGANESVGRLKDLKADRSW